MTRPVRPVALVILTAFMLYPGVALLYQGVYSFIAGQHFNLVGQLGWWMDLANQYNVSPLVVLGLKAAIGLAWIGGVLGLWAGDWKAYPLAMAAAIASLLVGGGPMVMGIVALICLTLFRENADQVLA